MSEKLKKDVLFVGIDGCYNDEFRYSGNGYIPPSKYRMKLLSSIRDSLRDMGLKAIIISPYREYSDVWRISKFGRFPEDNNWYSFNYLVLKDLPSLLKDYEYTHICIFYNDGYVINIDKWSDEFLEYDYIGKHSGQENYMNGGFALKSKNFLEKISDWITPEIFDEWGIKLRTPNEDVISQSSGINFKYASQEVANRFALGDETKESFGMHKDGFDFNHYVGLYGKIFNKDMEWLKVQNVDKLSEVEYCPIGGTKDKITYINLGLMPLVNNLCDTKESSLNCAKYPLAVQYFKKSKLSCLTHNVNPSLMFSEYSYKSGVVKAYSDHCKEMFGFVNAYLDLKDGDKVLDIGGNDGTLLKTFLEKKPHLNVLNVDASTNLTKLSIESGIPAYNEFWGVETAKKLNRKFKLITSTNVFQHTPPIVDFVEAVSMSLEKWGIWCLEFPYWKTNMETKQYDQIYHEHVYFYLLEPLKQLFERYNLRIIKVTPQSIHGGSLRLLISRIGEMGEAWQPCSYVDKFIQEEQLITEEYYKEWGNTIRGHIDNCINYLKTLKGKNKKIVGFGAAAKGCIFLNSANIDDTILDAVIDDTDLKQGKFIPGTGIQIYNREYLQNNQVDIILILAHNFKNVIIDDLRKTGYTGKFLVMFPTIEIID